jgi:hypothetical protein
MAQIDNVMFSFDGFPGYKGNPPTSETEYNNLFNDENPWPNKPAWSILQAEINRIEAEYAAKEYQRKRAAEYPSFADQFDTLYHGGYDAWKATIDSVKAKYPKP